MVCNVVEVLENVMKTLRYTWVLGAALIGGGTFLYAQPAPEGNDATVQVSADVSVTAGAKLSISDMVSSLTDMRKKVRDDNRHTLHLRETARRQKDVIKLNCVNDKLIQIKAQTNIFDAHARELEGSLAAQTDTRFGLYSDANITAQSIHKLREEAGLCVGEMELGSSDIPAEYTGPDITQPGGNPFDEGVEPPGYASPYK